MISSNHRGGYCIYYLVDMRLQREKAKPRAGSRLNKLVYVVAVLWLAVSLMLLVYHPGAAHAVQPPKTVYSQLARLAPQAAPALP